jgi:hypothetical protein
MAKIIPMDIMQPGMARMKTRFGLFDGVPRRMRRVDGEDLAGDHLPSTF